MLQNPGKLRLSGVFLLLNMFFLVRREKPSGAVGQQKHVRNRSKRCSRLK